MKNLFGEMPAAVKEAQKAQKGYFWLLEMLIFAVIFVVTQFAQFIVILSPLLIAMLTNRAYWEVAALGDIKATVMTTVPIVSSDAYKIASLLATIMAIIVVLLFCRFIQKRKLRTIGFYKKNALKEYLIGIVAGFGAFTVVVLLGWVSGGLTFEGISPTFSIGIFILFLLGFMVQGMSEEVLCRGYLLVSVYRRYPVVVGIAINALFFSALHLVNSGITILSLINLALFGVFASVYFLRRGNIWGVAAFHSIWNLVQGNFYGIKVSGVELNCTLFRFASVEGKELWNGGAFGLEGSVCATVVLVAATVFLYMRPAKDTGAEYIPVEADTAKYYCAKQHDITSGI